MTNRVYTMIFCQNSVDTIDKRVYSNTINRGDKQKRGRGSPVEHTACKVANRDKTVTYNLDNLTSDRYGKTRVESGKPIAINLSGKRTNL